MNLGIISLGCAKNKVDSELFLGVCEKYGINITNNIGDADIIVVNTCGFIESAKKEAIDTILEVVEYKQNNVTIIAMGCLVERYINDLRNLIPEVDIYIPIKDYEHIDEVLKKITNKNISHKFDYTNRRLTTSYGSAYVRIADGCDNNCSYCAIPLIRGKFISRPFDEIMKEVKYLVSIGIREVTLIAQDTTRYGTDLNQKERLQDLLREIAKHKEIVWIRLLYLYPDEITDEVLNEIAYNDKVVKYFDIPIQHASNRLLKLMNRRGSKELIKERIQKIRSICKGVIVRTTLIIGFPTESSSEVNELVDFIKEIKFERLGAFKYSKEEQTNAYLLEGDVSELAKSRRLSKVMKAQNEVSLCFNESLMNKEFLCIIEDYDFESLAYIGRSYMHAPDDADGKIYIYSSEPLECGEFVYAKVIDYEDYDLKAVYTKKYEI